MSTTMHTHGPIPTISKVYEATDCLIDAFVPIEHIAGSVQRIVDKWEQDGEAPDPLPTIADVGALFVFCEYVEQSADGLARDADRVRSLLVSLEGMRRESEAKGGTDA